MATYTTEVRRLVESHFDLGLKDYPIFDEAYRAGLNDKIIKHFYFREIGFETAGLFKFYLNQKMREIMPYYNQLYKSQLLEFNPFYNVDKTTRNDGTRNGNTSNISNTTTTGSAEFNSTNTGKSNDITNSNESNLNTNNSNSKKVHSDTPQGMLMINSIENETYASDADYGIDKSETVDNKTSNTSNSSLNENSQTGNNTNNSSVDNIDNTTTNSTESYLANVVGKEGSETYSEMLLKYRDTFINIDMMIINDLNELFMNVY